MVEFQSRIDFFTKLLVEEAGRNPAEDARRAGIIQGYRDFVECHLEDLEEK